MCSEAVLKYLQSTNRPYSVNDIFQNLHNAFSKNVIQKSLDELAEKGSIKEKVYGKQKIYCVIQTTEDVGNEDELFELNELIEKKSKEAHQLDQEIKLLELKLKELQSQPTTQQAEADNERLRKSNALLKDKLNQLRKGVSIISKEEWKKKEEELNKVTKECKKRSRWLKDMTDAVLENYNSSKNQLYDEIGIEM
ncbi:unnamed protein product [Nezara viridula]|uniref:Homologous-pairing protein 2 winged helix domain-containing protein n=1 Tax=Nezara viridula TaxID=85310 RepID=A0A9P0HCV7_NEZVI|nr:unnamed protein product [Nezara viridula]